MRSFRWWVAVSLTLPAVAAVQEAGAQALNPTYEYTQAGFAPPGTGYVLNVPGSYSYGNTYVSGAGSVPISDAQGTISPNVGFYDGYEFTISGAVANSATLTIDLDDLLQVDNLSARLFRAAGNTAPTLRAPMGGSLVEAWSMPIGSGPSDGEAVILSNVLLNPGTYVLQIRGLVTGSVGGSYAGVLNLAAPTPVPLPAAAWLLVSGLGALGVVKRRARS